MIKTEEMAQMFANETGVTKKMAAHYLSVAFDLAHNCARDYDGVIFKQHRFNRVVKKARNGVNPRTKAVVKVPEKVFIVYKREVKSDEA
jgi:nucleoid DNA-binding protein